MRKIKNIPVLILLSLFAVSAYAGILYNGNEYTETMMPYSQSGTTEYRIVVSGTISSYNDSRMTTFEINGVNMLSSSTLPATEDGMKYFIHFKVKTEMLRSVLVERMTGLNRLILPPFLFHILKMGQVSIIS